MSTDAIGFDDSSRDSSIPNAHSGMYIRRPFILFYYSDNMFFLCFEVAKSAIMIGVEVFNLGITLI